MKIDFNAIPEQMITALRGGEGELTAKMYESDWGKVMPCRLHPGSSIGPHCHETSDEICYVLYGNGIATCDGEEETLHIDACHICKKGSTHSIVNTGMTDLVMLAVIVEK